MVKEMVDVISEKVLERVMVLRIVLVRGVLSFLFRELI